MNLFTGALGKLWDRAIMLVETEIGTKMTRNSNIEDYEYY